MPPARGGPAGGAASRRRVESGASGRELMKIGRFWPDELTDDERAGLNPGVPGDLNRRPDVLVVGGGVVGVSTAVACERAGLGSVLLLERDQLGSGATGGAGGLLSADTLAGTYPAQYVALGKASIQLWRELQETVPGGVGITPYDSIKVEPYTPELAANMPDSAEPLTPDDVARLIPGLSWSAPGVRIPRQARMNPLRAVSRLAQGIGSVGTGVAVRGVTVRGERLVSVTTSAGEISPGAVIFATGGPPKLDGLRLEYPAGSLKGHILTTEPVSVRLGGGFAPIATQIEQERLLAGGTVDEGDDTPDVHGATIARIVAELEAALPALKGIAVSHAWVCFRPTHPDALPVIDRVPGLSNAWVTSGHFRHGILLAPATGRALARWVGSGKQPDEVVGLEIERLHSGQAGSR
ncbi:MAG: FAD-binding oxidoreductase [Chloroflexota bacterium]